VVATDDEGDDDDNICISDSGGSSGRPDVRTSRLNRQLHHGTPSSKLRNDREIVRGNQHFFDYLCF